MPNSLLDGLLGYWKLNESSGSAVADSGDFGNNGIVEDGDQQPVNGDWVPGRIGNALSFDGTGAYGVVIPSSPNLAIPGPFSVAAWVKLDGYGTFRIIAAAANPPTSGFVFGVYGSGTLLLAIYDGGLPQIVAVPYTFPLDKWFHVTATFDGAMMRVYVNSALAAGPQPSTFSGVEADFFISVPAEQGWEGLVDEVRLYNRALTASEVAELSSLAPEGSADLGKPVSVVQDGSSCPYGCGQGLATWSITPFTRNLLVQDAPFFYQPGRGPAVEVKLSYNLAADSDMVTLWGVERLPFGPGWAHNYGAFIELTGSDPAQAVVRMPDMRTDVYQENPADSTVFDPLSGFGIFNKLTRPDSETFLLEFKDHTVLKFENLGTELTSENPCFQLTQITDPNGHVVTLEYDDPDTWKLVLVTDALENETEFVWTESDNQWRVTAIVNSDVELGATFGYDAAHRLNSITDQADFTSSFEYEDSEVIPPILKSVTLPKTYPHKTAEFTFAPPVEEVPSRQVQSVRAADGAVWQYLSEGNQRIIVDPLNRRTTHVLNDFGGSEQIIDSRGKVTYQVYDNNRLLTRVIDRDLRVVDRFYDEEGFSEPNRGNLTSEKRYKVLYPGDPSVIGTDAPMTGAAGGNLLLDDGIATVAHDSIFSPGTNNFSAVCFYKSTTPPTGNHSGAAVLMLTSDNLFAQGWGLGLKSDKCFFIVGPEGGPHDFSHEFDADDMFDGNWHCVAMVVNSGTVYCYFDGEEIGSFSNDGSATSNEPLLLGNVTGWALGVVGGLKKFSYWSRALTAQEVEDLANGTWKLEGDESGLAAYWPMDDGEGDTVHEVVDDRDAELSGDYDWEGGSPGPAPFVLRTWKYNEDDMVIEATDPKGTVKYEYEDANFPFNPTKITDRLDHDTLIEYVAPTNNGAGKPAKITDRNGKEWEFGYDASGNLTSQKDPLDNETTHDYDERSRRISTTNALTQTTEFGYDDLNRLIKTTFPDETYIERTLNCCEELDVRDPAGSHWKKEYHPLVGGRVIKEIDPMGRVVIYNYDLVGQLISLANPKGAIWWFIRDELGRVIMLMDPLFRARRWTYDNEGRITSRTDENGDVTLYTHDVLGRLSRVVYPDDTEINYTYDDVDNRLTMEDTTGSWDWVYDAESRMLSAQSPQAENPTHYEYDNESHRIKLTDPDENEIDYGLDDAYRLISITASADPDPLVWSFSPDALGRVEERTMPNGIKTAYGYDMMSRIEQITHEDSEETPLLSFVYERDDLGNVTKVTRGPSGNYTTYEYDLTSQLTAERYYDNAHLLLGTLLYEYDAAGNRLKRTLQSGSLQVEEVSMFDAANQILKRVATGAQTFSEVYAHDANGNLTKETRQMGENESVKNLGYNFENNLLTFQHLFDETEHNTALRYSADGLRVEKTAPDSDETKFVLDGVQVTNEVGTDKPRFILGLAMIKSNDDVLFYLEDALGSVMALADEDEEVVGNYRYDAWGNVFEAPENDDNPYRWCGTWGYYWDKNTEMYLLGLRWYSPLLARFITHDPIGFASGDVNCFRPIGNNLVNKSDALGLTASFVLVPIGRLSDFINFGYYWAAAKPLPPSVPDANSFSNTGAYNFTPGLRLTSIPPTSSGPFDQILRTLRENVQTFGGDILKFVGGIYNDCISGRGGSGVHVGTQVVAAGVQALDASNIVIQYGTMPLEKNAHNLEKTLKDLFPDQRPGTLNWYHPGNQYNPNMRQE